MQPTSSSDYKQLLTDVIKKQIVILGPDITLSKARNVKGLTVADDGTVTDVAGNQQEIIQSLIDQFVQLSGLIVKKTMEPLLMLSQPTAFTQTPQVPQSQVPTAQAPLPTAIQQPAPVSPAEQTSPAGQAEQPLVQPMQQTAASGVPPITVQAPTAQAPTVQAPVMPTSSQTTAQPTAEPNAAPAVEPAPPTQPTPANNPLAA